MDAIKSEISKLRRGRGAGASDAIGRAFVGVVADGGGGREETDEDMELELGDATGELDEGVGRDEEGGAIEVDGVEDDAGDGGGGGGAGKVPTKVILTDSVPAPLRMAWKDSSVVALVSPAIL